MIRSGLVLFEVTDDTRGNAQCHTVRRDVFRNDGACANHGMVANGDPRQDRAICADPGSITNLYTRIIAIEIGGQVIMTGGGYYGVRANLRIISNVNSAMSIQLYIAVHRSAVTDMNMAIQSCAEVDAILDQAVVADADICAVDKNGSLTNHRFTSCTSIQIAKLE